MVVYDESGEITPDQFRSILDKGDILRDAINIARMSQVTTSAELRRRLRERGYADKDITLALNQMAN